MKIFYLDPNNNTPQFSYPILERLQSDFEIIYFSSDYSKHTNYYSRHYQIKANYLFSRRVAAIGSSALRKFCKTFTFPFHYCRIIFLMIIHKPSILHINWISVPILDFLLVKITRFLSIRVVINVHNYQPHDSIKNRFLETKIYSQTSALICFSNYIYQKLITLNSHLFLVNHGNVYEKEINQFKKKLISPKSSSFTLLFIGGIRPYKGIETLLQALKQLKSKTIHLRIVGDGEKRYLSFLTKVCKLFNLSHQVQFTFGFCDYQTMIPFIQQADCGIVPYKKASQSGVIYLFTALHKPVIVTNVGGLPEQVSSDHALICEPNADSLAASIIKMKEKVKKRSNLDFIESDRQNSLENTIKALKQIYETI